MVPQGSPCVYYWKTEDSYCDGNDNDTINSSRKRIVGKYSLQAGSQPGGCKPVLIAYSRQQS
jgi:hypothetical protein